MAESDTALGEVVGGKFEGDFVAGENADAIAAETACEVSENKTFMFKLDTEFTAGELLDDGTLYFDAVFFTHSVFLLCRFRLSLRSRPACGSASKAGSARGTSPRLAGRWTPANP